MRKRRILIVPFVFPEFSVYLFVHTLFYLMSNLVLGKKIVRKIGKRKVSMDSSVNVTFFATPTMIVVNITTVRRMRNKLINVSTIRLPFLMSIHLSHIEYVRFLRHSGGTKHRKPLEDSPVVDVVFTVTSFDGRFAIS